MTKELVLLGGGHAHMQTIQQLSSFVQKGYEVAVVQPSNYHYYSGMGPGMLGGTYTVEQIRFHTKELVESQGGKFYEDRAVRIDPEAQLVYLGDSAPLSYDVLSCNVGSSVPRDQYCIDSKSLYMAKPIEALERAKGDILEKLGVGPVNIAVIGGGPSATEIAGNVQQLCDKAGGKARIQLFGGRSFFAGKPRRVRKLAIRILKSKGIEILEGERVLRVEDSALYLENEGQFSADVIFWAVGVIPSSLFSESGMVTGESGGLPVNGKLQSIHYPNIFGGGDCIDFTPHPLEKVGVYAVRQNPTLLHNLMAALEGTRLHSFDPGGDYLLIYNLGDGDGVLSKWSATVAGSSAFRIKDYIDRKFMRTYQN